MRKPDHIKEAAKAMSDLHIFAAVAALMESSLVSSACHSMEARIVKLCQSEQQKCIRRYDRAVAAAGQALPRAERSGGAT